MQIRYEQLNGHLQKNLAPIYLLTGDEPLLMEEGCSAIRLAAKKQGFTEREVWQVETGFSWQGLLDAANSFSLFSNKQVLELRCTQTQLTETATKALLSYIAKPAEDKILLISVDKLDSKHQKSNWYQTLLKIGITIQIWPLEGDNLVQWVKQRLTTAGLTTTTEGLRLLAERAEGNLLSIAQEIEKLSLLFGKTQISADTIADIVADNARYDVFKLSDAVLQGNSKRAIRILFCLKEEGIDPILILWSLTKEIRTLASMAYQVSRHTSVEKVLLEQRVWEKRKPLLRQALQRHSVTTWRRLLHHACKIDQTIKGLQVGNIWDELTTLCLKITKNQ